MSLCIVIQLPDGVLVELKLQFQRIQDTAGNNLGEYYQIL